MQCHVVVERIIRLDMCIYIKTSGSESRGQEEAVWTRISGLCDHYSELFARMVGLNF